LEQSRIEGGPRRRLIIRRFLLVAVVLYFVGTVFGGSGLGWIALHPPRRPLTPQEEVNVQTAAIAASQQFANVSITSPDGTTLRAWFLKPHSANGDSVVLLHGVSDNRLGMYGYAKWLLNNHYAVLLPDARAHGLNDGIATYGLRESDDIHRWVDWLEDHGHPRCVYGLGESMGAAQLLQSLATETRFCAVVAESPFASFREVAYARFGREFYTGPRIGSTFFRPSVDVGFLYVRLRYGLNMEDASPKQAVEKTKTPVLLIHGLSDRNIPPFHSDEIHAHNPTDIVVWKVQGAVHTGAHKVAPQEFERRVLAWFESHSSPQTREPSFSSPEFRAAGPKAQK
jgi:dipeptidyl aminopeptidase/acylaminoacyl peptidase